MAEIPNFESGERPRELSTRNRVLQALALCATLTACDTSKQTETPQTQDAGLQTQEVVQDAQVDATAGVDDAGVDKKDAGDWCKLPPIDPELQKMVESHKVKVGYYDVNGKVVYEVLTLDEITGKDARLCGVDHGDHQMLWSFIKNTQDKPELQTLALKRMTLHRPGLDQYIVTKEGKEAYSHKQNKVVFVIPSHPVE